MPGEHLMSGTDYTSAEVEALVREMGPLAARAESDHVRGVAIYGAGFVGTWAAQYLKSLGAVVTHFIDQDPKKNGTSIRGIKVVLPTDPVVAAGSTIYLAARHAVKEVQSAMARADRVLISFDGYYVVRNYERFIAIRDGYFEDEKSRRTYNALLVAMLSGSTASCRAVMEKDMYFAVPEFSGTFDEIFVDAGAFVGDTLERFIWENMGTFKHIYAFEPGRRQFAALQQRVRRLSDEWAFATESVTTVKAGLSSSEGRMICTFVDDSPLRHGLTGDTPATGNAESVPIHALDSFLQGRPATFIKVDVEGMEMELLMGAQRTIRHYRPKLALCAYHYPSDLFEIAEYVRSLVPEYKFRLRQHAPIFGDFVLYCHVPEMPK